MAAPLENDGKSTDKAKGAVKHGSEAAAALPEAKAEAKAEVVSGPPVTCKVVPGDNLWNVSRTLLTAKNGKEPSSQEIMTMVNQFVSLNAIVNRDLIYPDQVLKIPQI